jgi:hypothetical protein
MHMLWLYQVFLLMIIAFSRKACQEGGMTHENHFFVLFNRSALEVVFKEFPKLESSFIHFKGVFHSIREFIVCKLQ